MTRVLGGVGPQPGPHVHVGIGGRLALGQPSVRGAGKPNRLAGQPFRHAQRVLEHVHGAALGGRAQNFPFATSRSASLTSSASANNRFKRAFCSRSSLSSLAASGPTPPYARRQLYSVAADTPSSAAISSPVLPSAANSSARRSLRTMSSAECRFRPAMMFIVPFSPTSGHRTLKPVGLIQWEHASRTLSQRSNQPPLRLTHPLLLEGGWD